ncbi:MAG: septum site-determining protein MinC [Chloroflexia bacterium]|nr:septum site-determining protein MinC [Chloroflexia bacterium]
MEQLIQIKGDRKGLRLLLAENAPFEVLLQALEEQFQRGEAFFRGADVLIDVGDRSIEQAEAQKLEVLLQKWTVNLRAIGTTNRHSRGAIHDAGLRATHSDHEQAAPSQAPAFAHSTGESLFVVRTVRSGQLIRYHGPITILGDVNPGAEVISGEDVVVWGRVRGVVHAGATGNEDSVVCALELQPTQLRISNLAARSPEEALPSAGPEVAYIEEGRIVVAPWDTFRKS